MDASNFIIALYDEPSGLLSVPFADDENHDVPPSWPAQGSLTGVLISSRQSLLLNKESTQQLAEKENIQVRGTRSECWMGVPILFGEKILGAMIIQSYTDANAYDERSVELLETIANQVSSYISRIKIQEEAQKLSKVVVQSPVTIVITDPNGTIEFVNPKFTETTGYTYEEAIGQNPRILKSGKSSPEFYQQLWKTIKSGNEWQGEFQNRRKNGEIYWEKAIIAPIFDSSGTLTHFMALKEDITEKKKLMDELIVEKEKAKQSEQLKTAFLQNMSHEIRTPLNGLLGFSYLLTQKSLEPEKVREYASIMQSSGNRLLELLNNIIDLSKIESGSIELNYKSIPLQKFVKEVLDPFRVTAHSKGIALISESISADSEYYIESDELKLNQILANLIDNALKFTISGKIEIGYSIRKEEVVFFVKDTGRGIPLSEQHKIFERFYQADMSISRGFEGSGLGLPICKGLVKALKGQMWIESMVGVGTTMYFSVPLKPVIGENPLTSEQKGLLKQGFSKILIAEDDDFSFALLEAMLEHTSCKILRAVDGVEAVQACLAHPDLDLVLMDIKMPKMNGLDATRQIKFKRPDLPIIAQTAYAFESELRSAIEAGCDDYITKPISPEKLNQVLIRCLTVSVAEY